MLQVCMNGTGATPGSGMSLGEYRAHYAVWAILASPLVLGADVRSLAADNPACLDLLRNADIVAVNQDPAGLPVLLRVVGPRQVRAGEQEALEPEQVLVLVRPGSGPAGYVLLSQSDRPQRAAALFRRR